MAGWKIRPAKRDEADRLTEIAHAAKRHHGYPEEWIQGWSTELTFDDATLDEQAVFVAEADSGLAGVCGLSRDGRIWEVEHLWVDPASMGEGLGSALLGHAIAVAREAGGTDVVIVSDPHARLFYEGFGARFVGWVPSTPRNRRLPKLILKLA